MFAPTFAEARSIKLARADVRQARRRRTGCAARSAGLPRIAGVAFCSGERWHDLLREASQLLFAAKHREQDILSAGIIHCRQLGADFLRRSIERVLLSGAALARIGENMRAALASWRARNAQRALGVLGLTS
jgi:hypothetical protein